MRPSKKTGPAWRVSATQNGTAFDILVRWLTAGGRISSRWSFLACHMTRSDLLELHAAIAAALEETDPEEKRTP